LEPCHIGPVFQHIGPLTDRKKKLRYAVVIALDAVLCYNRVRAGLIGRSDDSDDDGGHNDNDSSWTATTMMKHGVV
jgi:hypothetical protein